MAHSWPKRRLDDWLNDAEPGPHISAANDSDEGGQPIARCTLRGTLANVWPSIVATQD